MTNIISSLRLAVSSFSSLPSGASINSSHSPFLSRPQEVAALLHTIGNQTPQP